MPNTVPSRSLVGLQHCTSKYALQGSLTHPCRIKLLTDSYLQEKQITFRQWRSPSHISRPGIPRSASVDVFVPSHISWYAKSTFLFSWRYCFSCFNMLWGQDDVHAHWTQTQLSVGIFSLAGSSSSKLTCEKEKHGYMDTWSVSTDNSLGIIARDSPITTWLQTLLLLG